MHFRTARQPLTNHTFKFGEKDMNIVNHYKYLGVMLDEHLTYDMCANMLSDSAGRALGGIISKYKELKDIGFHTFTKMHNTAVVGVNDYASEIWGYKDFAKTNQIQNRALRYFLGVHRFTRTAGLQGECGWLIPRYRRFICMLNVWNRMIKMNNNRLTKFIFMYDMRLCKSNWSSEIKHILFDFNLQHVFQGITLCDMRQLKTNICSSMHDKWVNSVHNKPKLRTYKIFKDNLNAEQYVTHYMSRRSRSLLAQFRLGILPLHIETGRYNNTVLENRLCLFCSESYCIEDEFHFLIKCELYKPLRETLYSQIAVFHGDFLNLDDNSKFTFILCKCHKQLAVYLCNAWELRQTNIYINKL